MRFCHGTWAGILQERARRIQESKEAAAAARLKARREQEELTDLIKKILLVFAICVTVVVAFLFLVLGISRANEVLYVSNPALMH